MEVMEFGRFCGENPFSSLLLQIYTVTHFHSLHFSTLHTVYAQRKNVSDTALVQIFLFLIKVAYIITPVMMILCGL